MKPKTIRKEILHCLKFKKIKINVRLSIKLFNALNSLLYKVSNTKSIGFFV